MKRVSLKVEERKILGKKVKKLRREGLLPANIYGRDIKSQTVQLPLAEFEKIFKEAGETQVIDLSLERTKYPVLIKNIQLEPRTNVPLHADFYKVNLKEEIKAMVPIVAMDEAKAVADKIGLLLQPLSEVEVEALPTEIPEKIETNVIGLAEIDQQIAVGDLKVPAGVKILTDPTQVVFKIGELVTKEAEELTREEKTAAAAAAAEAAAKRGEAPSEEGPTPPPAGAGPAEEEKPAGKAKPKSPPPPPENKS